MKSLKASSSVATISQLGHNQRNNGGYNTVAVNRQKHKSLNKKAFDDEGVDSQIHGADTKQYKYTDWNKYDTRLKPPTPASPTHL